VGVAYRLHECGNAIRDGESEDIGDENKHARQRQFLPSTDFYWQSDFCFEFNRDALTLHKIRCYDESVGLDRSSLVASLLIRLSRLSRRASREL
jgi:hypothetical protein